MKPYTVVSFQGSEPWKRLRVVGPFDHSKVVHESHRELNTGDVTAMLNQAFADGLEWAGLCRECGQKDTGQTGEYPCVKCGLPALHDDVDPPSTLKDRERAAFERAKELAAEEVEAWSLPTIQSPSMWLIDKGGIASEIRSIRFEEGK